MGIYSTMLVFNSSEIAQSLITDKAAIGNSLQFDLRAKYPFYKLSIGQSLAFNLTEFKENNIRSSVSQFNKRHNCELRCIKHDTVLEVARIK